MSESHDPDQAEQSGKEHLKAAAEDLKTAAAGKIEEFRQTAGQKTEEFRKLHRKKLKRRAVSPRMLGPVLHRLDRVGWPKARPISERIQFRLC